MIKIDGEKIKKLREGQNLTQLYMATAVEVTTDTISRWENKRYPTIKEENAEKLAEALGVNIEDILLQEEHEESPESLQPDNEKKPIVEKKRSWTPAIFAITLAVILALIGFIVGRRLMLEDTASTIHAIRIMPPRAIPNTPFPVVIEVSQSQDKATSIILKDLLPKGCEIVQTSPISGSSFNQEEVKWIHKLKGTMRFSYLAKISGETNTDHRFDGTISTSSHKEAIRIEGNNTIELGEFHWADLDGDNTISDKEILTVFDYYSGIDNFTINIEFIEKMWLGSRYTWDKDKNLITITP